MTGTVKRKLADKGFGFILADGSADEYFFHSSAVVSDGGFPALTEGQRVEFQVGQGQKGPRAEDVRAR